MQREAGEIVLPERKPALEWILGAAHQKVSPKYTHAALQGRMVTMLGSWAAGRGRVGTEWRFRVAPPGEVRRPLVPDVAYASFDRLALHDYDEAEEPALAPDVAVEILSPRDRRPLVDEKIRVYLAAGAAAVVVVDPRKRIVEIHEAAGMRALGGADRLTVGALPGFTPAVDEIFADPTLPPP